MKLKFIKESQIKLVMNIWIQVLEICKNPKDRSSFQAIH